MNDFFATRPMAGSGGTPIPPEQPSHIARYRVERVLGEGGFGRVYLAYDDQLQRRVAIKVPHRNRVSTAEEAAAYLTEARTVANLDHPGIVPVHDVGSTDEFPCFIMSKYIEGRTLAQKIRDNRPSFGDAAELIALIAEALHYAHRKGLVHRDVKPGNILLDTTGRPFVVDFGLALREQDAGRGPQYAGTPAYMSPEQARGEGHRVDGRSDIFSLGVVFYELLTGKRPFHGGSTTDLLGQIANIEASPPRQSDDEIPKELERICLKCLSKRASDRYSTAKDIADDLRYWMSRSGENPVSREQPAPSAEPEVAGSGLRKDAFLSYAAPDKDAVFRLCRLLEEKGIRCWIAPRDMTAGADYSESIIRAIETTTTTVLMLSASANASVHVKNEVERATSKRKRVIPVRLEDVRPSPSLELHLATTHWVDAWRLSPEQVVSHLATALREVGSATPSPESVTPVLTPDSSSHPLRIVPKGLRSFDAHDADFFLELLPGARDRNGLPDSIRFWKTRIEQTDPDETFSVGLIYGPSGCGKSSLVKAGLIPSLSHNVVPDYVESTADETETRLLNGLRKRCPGLPADLGLKEALASLRLGKGIPAGKKVVIILDQFEQWLHAKKDEENTELVQALRQCDGGRVQCLVMVRDDFWMAATRFMRELEVRILDGQNSAAVDLFPIRHAEKVLAAFGRAFGTLPGSTSDDRPEQKQFLEQAVSGLSQEGKVISVRLALFAEMMKGKPWTPASLREVGGIEGVGVTFLEETFSASTAPPDHRFHQKAARAVLKALLPDSGTDIKGHMRSHDDLLEAAGYGTRPKDFEDLIRILDSEIRLITPTDPEGQDDADPSSVQAGAKYYQLTHDYLVPSLRDWLTRKQRETRRGRAELLLADRAAAWSDRQDARHLPSLWQWLTIRCLTLRKYWTLPQRRMMRKAGRVHGVRSALVAVLLLIATFTGLEIRERVREQQKATHAAGLVQRLLDAETAQAPAIVTELSAYRTWTDPLLTVEHNQAAANSRQKLHSSLGLLAVDPQQAEYLYGRLLVAAPHELPVLRDALSSQKDSIREKLWSVAEQPPQGHETQRLRVACVLAAYDTDDERWAKVAGPVVDQMVGENPVFLGLWLEGFRRVRKSLLPSLAVIYRDVARSESERSLATNILADYAAGQPDVLADLIMDADEKQFAIVFLKLQQHGESGLTLLQAETVKAALPEATEDDKEKLAMRQANAAVALLKMNQPATVWPLLKHTSDPRTRTYLIHRFAPLGADPMLLVKRLGEEPDVTIRRALLQSLGEFGSPQLGAAEKERVIVHLLEAYRDDPDPGFHGAAEWLLRQWKQEDKLSELDAPLRIDEKGLQARKREDKRRWYVNRQGQTMVILQAEKFSMGSPDSEPDRISDETLHSVRLRYDFAISSKEVTKAEYRKFQAANSDVQRFNIDQFSRTDDSPQGAVDWYDAARYCNWLSDIEGLPKEQWCYEPNAEGKYAEGMKPAADFLERSGFRLPTEAEWEFACRSGTETSRYYGMNRSFLDRYAWFVANSTERQWPVGLLKPNDFGLFDIQGNALEWCHERYRADSAGDEADAPDVATGVQDKFGRVLRGGSSLNQPSYVRSAYRFNGLPTARIGNIGFRLARTYR